MKRVQLTLIVVIVAATALTLAQQTPPSPPQQTSPAPQTQSPAPSQPAGQPQVPALEQRPPHTKTLPQAKTQEEYKAYNDAAGISDPVALEAAANDFGTKFKDSELRPLLYQRTMNLYQNANNAEKTLEMARKVLAMDPNNPVALVTSATVLAERTRDTDLDRNERLNEAITNAKKALATVETDLAIPPGTPPERVEAARKLLNSMAYAAIGTAELSRDNYPAAEANLRKSTEINAVQPDAITWLRLAVVLDHERKYQEALTATNKALELSPPGTPQRNLAAQERDRLLKLTGAPAAAPVTAPAPPAAPAEGAPTAPGKQPPPK